MAKKLTGSGEEAVALPESIRKRRITMTHAGVAAVLSLVLPGTGQIFNGDFIRGAFWLIATPGFYFSSWGVLGATCHLVSAYTAYHRAKMKEQADSCHKGARGESVTIECCSPCPAR